MAKHLMIDMETMAVSPNAVVLSLGAVHFDPYSDDIADELYFKIDLDDQDKLKREIDPNTLDWWSKQDPAIMEEAFSPNDRIPLADAMDRFHKFAWGCSAFWSHGATFDLVIIENIYRQLNKNLPWNYWQLRDTRTLFDLGFDPCMPKDSKHDALQDARRQAVGVQNVFSQLRKLSA
ncbi:MAG: 3'-5' exoribonuclease [Proteobacteria bacterium]|nr:3'-5' exoribonuclease [Pseudomonadota bacterium]NBP14099.1 3'-5' exoribonuclease [bacterium]